MNANSRLLRMWGLILAAPLITGGLWAQDGLGCLPIPDPDCSVEVPLLAGQYTNVGSVVVQSRGSIVCVTYELSEEALLAGWLLYETHLAVAGLVEDIPQTAGNKWGTNPIPGQFPYAESFVEGVPCYSFCIDIRDLGLQLGDNLYIAAHAVVRIVIQDVVYMDETAWGNGERFNERGDWGMYFLFGCPGSLTLTRYIGYEDLPANCDYDYNDFGMDMTVREIFDGEFLQSVEMLFLARAKIAGHVHDIHILRSLGGSYTYTIARSDPAQGNEDAAGVGIAGSGDFDVVLFDSAYPTVGDIVSITITMDPGNEENTVFDGGPAPRFDLEPMFSLYHPWMRNRVTGEHIIISTVKPAVSPLPGSGYSVPSILVIPTSGWPIPGEAVTITWPYPLFYDYYSTQSPAYVDWWVP